jgi:hypothetical protein
MDADGVAHAAAAAHRVSRRFHGADVAAHDGGHEAGIDLRQPTKTTFAVLTIASAAFILINPGSPPVRALADFAFFFVGHPADYSALPSDLGGSEVT